MRPSDTLRLENSPSRGDGQKDLTSPAPRLQINAPGSSQLPRQVNPASGPAMPIMSNGSGVASSLIVPGAAASPRALGVRRPVPVSPDMTSGKDLPNPSLARKFTKQFKKGPGQSNIHNFSKTSPPSPRPTLQPSREFSQAPDPRMKLLPSAKFNGQTSPRPHPKLFQPLPETRPSSKGKSSTIKPFRKLGKLSRPDMKAHSLRQLPRSRDREEQIPDALDGDTLGRQKSTEKPKDEPIVISGSSDTSTRNRKRKKRKSQRKKAKLIEEYDRGEVSRQDAAPTLQPYKAANQLDVWYPFVDQGIMYEAYYPPSSYLTSLPSRWSFPQQSYSVAPWKQSHRHYSAPRRRSYFNPTFRAGHTPVYIPALDPNSPPPFAYQYDRVGVMKSSPPTTETGTALDHVVGQRLSSSPPEDRSTLNQRKRTSASTSENLTQKDMKDLTLALKKDAIVAGQIFEDMDNVMNVQSRQLQILASSLYQTQQQMYEHHRESLIASRKRQELEQQLAIARHGRLADRRALDELLRRADRRLAAALTTGNRFGIPSIAPTSTTFFGQPEAQLTTATVAIGVPHNHQDNRKVMTSVTSFETDSSSANSFSANSSPVSSPSAKSSSAKSSSAKSSSTYPSSPANFRPAHPETSIKLSKRPGDVGQPVPEAQQEDALAQIHSQPFNSSLPPELQAVLVRPTMSSTNKTTFAVVGDGGALNVVDIQGIVAENSRLYNIVGALEKRLATLIAEMKAIGDVEARLKEQIDLAAFAKSEREVFLTQISRLKAELEVEKGLAARHRNATILADLSPRSPPKPDWHAIPRIITTGASEDKLEIPQRYTYTKTIRRSSGKDVTEATSECEKSCLEDIQNVSLMPQDSSEESSFSYRSPAVSLERKKAEIVVSEERERQTKDVEAMLDRALQKQASLKEADIERLQNALDAQKQITKLITEECEKSAEDALMKMAETSVFVADLADKNGFSAGILHLPLPPYKQPSASAAHSPEQRCRIYHEQIEGATNLLNHAIKSIASKTDLNIQAEVSETSKKLSEFQSAVEEQKRLSQHMEAKYSADMKKHLQKVGDQAAVLSKAASEIEILRKRAARAGDADRLEAELIQVTAARDTLADKVSQMVTSIQDTSTQFESRLETARRQFEQTIQDKEAIRQELDKSRSEIRKLQSTLTSTTEMLEKAEATILELSPETRDKFIDVLALRAKSADAQISTLTRQIEELKDQKSKAESIRKSLKIEIEEARKKVKNLESMFEQVNTELNHKAMLLGEERSERLARERLYKETKLRNAFVEQQLVEHVQTIEAKDQKINEILKNREKFKEALQIVGDKYKEVQQKLETTETSLENEKAVSLKLEHVIEKDRRKNDELRIEIEKLLIQKSDLLEKLERADLILIRRATELDEVTERLDKKAKLLNETIQKTMTLEEQIRNLEDQMSEGEKSKSFIEERASYTERQKQIIGIQSEALRKDLSRSQEELMETKKEIVEAEHELNMLRLQLNQMNDEKSILNNHIKTLINENTELSLRLSQTTIHIDNLKSEIDSMTLKENQIIKEAAKMKMSCIASSGNLEDLQDTLKDMLKEKDQAIAALTNQLKAREDQWQKAYELLKCRYTQLQKKIEEVEIGGEEVIQKEASIQNVFNIPSELNHTQSSSPKDETGAVQDQSMSLPAAVTESLSPSDTIFKEQSTLRQKIKVLPPPSQFLQVAETSNAPQDIATHSKASNHQPLNVNREKIEAKEKSQRSPSFRAHAEIEIFPQDVEKISQGVVGMEATTVETHRRRSHKIGILDNRLIGHSEDKVDILPSERHREETKLPSRNSTPRRRSSISFGNENESLSKDTDEAALERSQYKGGRMDGKQKAKRHASPPDMNEVHHRKVEEMMYYQPQYTPTSSPSPSMLMPNDVGQQTPYVQQQHLQAASIGPPQLWPPPLPSTVPLHVVGWGSTIAAQPSSFAPSSPYPYVPLSPFNANTSPPADVPIHDTKPLQPVGFEIPIGKKYKIEGRLKMKSDKTSHKKKRRAHRPDKRMKENSCCCRHLESYERGLCEAGDTSSIGSEPCLSDCLHCSLHDCTNCCEKNSATPSRA